MELIHFDFNKTYNLGKIAACLGEFDGLHLAHQALINKTIEMAKMKHAKSVVFTFDPHPDFILKKREDQGYLTPLDVKAKVIEGFGVDYLIVIPFSIEVSKIPYKDFEELFLKKFDIVKLIVGFDYKYGHRGQGKIENLKENFDVEVIEKMTLDGEKIGSNEIRELLLSGNLEDVKKTLGRYYNITGRVVDGNKVGRTIGIRTANIELDYRYQLIRIGIYAVIVTIDEKMYVGVCNIGHNPTLNYVEKPRLEVHILDFNGSIYNEIISVDFVHFLRDELKFDNRDDLIKQIHQDILDTKKLVVLD